MRPVHIDRVLTKIVHRGAPTVANDALRYLFRMIHFAVKRRWIESNPVYGFEISDAGSTECSRVRWLNREELVALGRAMRETPDFGRLSELAVWLLLALCVRKMELLSAKWSEFDLEKGVWSPRPSRTKMNSAIDIPLADPVVEWLIELRAFACGSVRLFPARQLIHMKAGVPRKNRFEHVSPDTLNVAGGRHDRVQAWRDACLAHPAAQQVTAASRSSSCTTTTPRGAGNGALLPGRQRSSFSFEPDWRSRPWPPKDKYGHSATDRELGL